MMKSRWIAAAAAACAIALLVVPMMLRSAGPGEELRETPNPVGTANLDLTLKDMHGADVNLADYKGKNVVLLFYPLDWTPG